MNETIKYNRDLLGKRNPFEKSKLRRTGKSKLVDDKKLSDKDRENLISDLRLRNQRQRRKEVSILFVSIVVTVILILIFKETLLETIIDFLK